MTDPGTPHGKNRRPGSAFSAGVVVVRQVDGDWRFLLLRSFQYWDFPKGGVEPGELPLAAALRETLEEAGLSGLEFRWGEAFIDTEPYSRGKIARYYLAASPQGDVILHPSPTLGRPEHEEYRWVSATEARELLVPRVQRVLDWAGTRLDAPG
jgi:8-oxo-dGTP pyrophosphatase MutT (NUDIX family)